MIAFDVDGVVLDLETRILDVAEDILGERPQRVCQRYSFEERFALPGGVVERIWTRFNERDLWGDLPAFPRAIEAVNKVQSLGQPVAFVTGIVPAAHALRERNLKRLGLRNFTLFCTGSPVASKRHVLQQLTPHAFVDDRLHHLHDANGVVEHLAWIDLGDEQGMEHGQIPNLNRHPSLAHWLNTHERWLTKLPPPISSAL